ncbi:ATP-dependent DNA helicase PIF1-like [Hydra vulgaris]|uniref:ATP-dependent DNA helicase n=1 Tax=Hydra vulgaris TaxID=6087 RepID=A0ABM4BU35_HYDVU
MTGMMNKIKENDDKKKLKLLSERKNLLYEDEMMVVNKIIKKCYLYNNKKDFNGLIMKSIFFNTGGAGCEKSYIVKEIAQKTGVKSLDYYKLHMHPDIKKTWLETDVLIIDEISMINAQTFDLLHLIACEIKQCYDELFGGIQVFACDKRKDAQFFGALNEIRFGQVSDQTIDYFMTRCFEKDENLNNIYTSLFFRNMKVDVYKNNNKMKNIKHEGYWFYAKDVIKNSNIQCSFQIPAAVYLKIGVIVMLVRNISVEEGLCNGTVGTVILIEDNAVWVNMNGKEVKIECVKEEILDCSHAVVGSRLGLPLKLAFSFTVHKAQGCTINKAYVNFNSKAFNNSLYYVSLSRVCNINDIFIIVNNKLELQKLFENIKMKFQYQTEENDDKDEDIVEESQLYSETQSPDKIVYDVEQKTMEGFRNSNEKQYSFC